MYKKDQLARNIWIMVAVISIMVSGQLAADPGTLKFAAPLEGPTL